MSETQVAPTAAHRDSAAGRARRRLAPAVIVLLLVVVAYGGWRTYQRHRTDVAAAQALSAAERYALTLTSIDGEDPERYFAAARDGATGALQDMYATSTPRLQRLFADKAVVAHGRVIDSAVKSASPTHVTVLLFVDQAVTNAEDPDP
ncbi:MAG TPA: Mce protein, partial [Mycolicibacillus parakoreensis]|nr:Mce protein [Mycolicibacillus parakoreensis]